MKLVRERISYHIFHQPLILPNEIRIYANFENSSHFICSLNLDNPESTVFIIFRITNIASGDQEIVNSLIGNNNGKINSKFITFYKTFGGLGLLISKAQAGACVAIVNDGSSSIKPDLKFPSSKANCTVLNNWHVILVTWTNKGETLVIVGLIIRILQYI